MWYDDYNLEICHLGQDIWLLSELPWGNGGNDPYSEYKANEFFKSVRRRARRHLIAFTANQEQRAVGRGLKKLGFKNVLSFYSAHANSVEEKETITLWYKYNSKAKKRNKVRPAHLQYNCSIITKKGHDDTHRCVVRIRKGREKAPVGFRQINKTNLYIKINGSKVW